MRDPAEEDDGEVERRVDEDVRELRWAAFKEIATNFAQTEGWPGVLHAVAQAMRESPERV
jgi:hypothetical protein